MCLKQKQEELLVFRGTKRRREVDDHISYCSDEIERLLSTPKKKKLHTTSQYIYENLFQAGKESDVTVVTLGRSWPLHKLYLSQSPYFASLFSGRWKEWVFSVYCIFFHKIFITFPRPKSEHLKKSDLFI